jgi:hypothetical protein
MAWRGPVKKITNPTPNRLNNGEEKSNGLKDKPRENVIRRDADKIKNFKVQLIDVDTTILEHVENRLKIEVMDNGQMIPVPINYASPERWKAINKDGFIRDQNGKVQTPAIAFRRTTMQRNDTLITFNRYLHYSVEKKYSEKNKYDRFSIMNGFEPVKEKYDVTLPDHVVINYDFIVWTDLVEQLNSVIEKINFATEDYWGDKQRFKFRTSISDYAFETEVAAETDRIVKGTFTLMVNAYLLPETFEDRRPIVQKYFSPRKVIFSTEVVNDLISTETSGKRTKKNITETAIAKSNYFPKTVPYINIENGAVGSINVAEANNVNTSANIDTFSAASGNAVNWLISIGDGTNFYSSQIIANWNSDGSNVSFSEFGVNVIGDVTATFSVIYFDGSIILKVIVNEGVWNIKAVRTLI